MSGKKILHLGLPSHPFDSSISDEQVQAAVQIGADKAIAAGYIVQLTFLDPKNHAGALSSLQKELSTGDWDALIIGGGLRMAPKLTAEFEKAVNIARETKPEMKILFQAAPSDIYETLQRGFEGVVVSG